MATVTFRDETAAGTAVGELRLTGLPESPGRMTARELIRLRVREEVARRCAAPAGPPPDRFHSLGWPEPAGAEPGGRCEDRRLDWERQAAIAERAFERNGFFLLVGDRQVEDLDEMIELTGETELVFVKLVPLAGG